MTNLSHEEAYSELAAVALDAVPSEVNAAVREHAAACPECGPELMAMEEVAAQLGQLMPAAAVNPGRAAGIRSRLVMRARAEREARSSAAPGGRPDLARGVASLTGLGNRLTPGTQRAVDAEVRKVVPPQKRTQRLLSGPGLWALAASIAFVVVAVQLARVMADRDALRAELASRADTISEVDSTQRAVAENEALVAAMAGPDVKIVPLSKNATRMGRMFWNPSSNDWTFVVYTMPPPKPGMTYQVWLVTDSAKISAGTFNPDSSGHAFMQAKYALDRNALKAVAVTEEPAGGMPAPTGPIVVSGSATP
ncbi:MAG TPA: anti-sigma factor [Rhodothermia bacterium]|nr:anti-sigma factor [Rhodothermia bacterium]